MKDLSETREIYDRYDGLLKLMLIDKSRTECENGFPTNIVWANEDYGFDSSMQITADDVNLIVPRNQKVEDTRKSRSKKNAEVFTPSWVCNKQNNLVDDAWFGRSCVFNRETISEGGSETWIATEDKVEFPSGKSFVDYVLSRRLEITCGEAPYLVSRYDTVTGRYIPPTNGRIGFLDRKLRVIGENVTDEQKWNRWALEAVKAIYGYEFQGDNLFLARENILFTVSEYHSSIFGSELDADFIYELADVITWNIWQMDGLKNVAPLSCKKTYSSDLLGNTIVTECEGCKRGTVKGHNGIRCRVIDWQNEHPYENRVFFDELIK